MKLTMIYVPCAIQEAEHLSKLLIEEKLAACCNILESKSIYLWKQEVKTDSERILLIKTLPEKKDDVIHRIKYEHSYDAPAIISWDVESHSEKYNEWTKHNLN